MVEKTPKFKIPIVNILYIIINFLQLITTTSLFWLNRKKNPDLFKKFVTFVNLFWFSFVILVLFFKWTHPIIVFLIIFRLWEIFIINVFMFLFRQGASKSADTDDYENNLRLFILLVFQYITMILIFAAIYYNIFTYSADSFIIGSNRPGSILTWVYFSTVTIATIGYGDISPLSGLAKISTISEILFGMFFILIFVTNILSNIKFCWSNNTK